MFLNKIKRCNSSNSFLTFSNWFLSFFKSHNSSKGCLYQTWRVYKSKALFCISRILNTFPINSLQALNLFELLLLLCTKSFLKFSGFLNLENLCYSFFSSLLPLPKRILQRLTVWILFVSLFSLFQKIKGLTAWILLCLPSPVSKNSKWHSLRILLILPIP